MEAIDLSDDFKLFARSTGPINETFSAIVARAASDKTARYRGKKPHRSAIINAIVLWLDSQSPETQREVVRFGLERLNRHLDTGTLEDRGEAQSPPAAPIPRPETQDTVSPNRDSKTGKPLPKRTGSKRIRRA